MNDSDINDVRAPREFRGVTFSQFSKTAVKKELMRSLLHGKLEPACYWGAELVCAGHFGDLWETVILLYAKHIHLGNIKLASYLEMRCKQFQQIVRGGFTHNELALRNLPKIRKLFAEMACILCDAKQKSPLQQVKVQAHDFDLEEWSSRFHAPSRDFAQAVFRDEDPADLYLPLNELGYHLSSRSQDAVRACYWMEWIMHLVAHGRKHKQPWVCARRDWPFVTIPSDQQKEVVWMLWDLCLTTAAARPLKLLHRTIASLLTLYVFRGSASSFGKRRFLLYFAVQLLCEPEARLAVRDELVRASELSSIAKVMDRIDRIYANIKANEHSPNTDYLFFGDKNRQLESTIQKLEAMNAFDQMFIPRAQSSSSFHNADAGAEEDEEEEHDEEHDEDDGDARKRSDDVVGGGRDRGKGVVFV